MGNTMTQHSPGGDLLFLHTNLSPKWNLQVPGDFKAYTRRQERSPFAAVHLLLPRSQCILAGAWALDAQVAGAGVRPGQLR